MVKSRIHWEPSGKFDFHVRYDAPVPTLGIHEIIATRWDDYCDNSSITPEDEDYAGRVVIKEEDSSGSEEHKSVNPSGKEVVMPLITEENNLEYPLF